MGDTGDKIWLEPVIDTLDNKIVKFSEWLQYGIDLKIGGNIEDYSVVLTTVKEEFDRYFCVREKLPIDK